MPCGAMWQRSSPARNADAEVPVTLLQSLPRGKSKETQMHAMESEEIIGKDLFSMDYLKGISRGIMIARMARTTTVNGVPTLM